MTLVYHALRKEGKESWSYNGGVSRTRIRSFSTVRKACLYLRRALRLRCPECGISPIFMPAARVRSLYDWFTPLDGCPHCGYAYEREDGYFLIATWGINYGLIGLAGLGIALTLGQFFDPPLWQQLAWGLPALALACIWMARTSKAIWLAIDHFFDPHRSDRG